MPSRELTSRPLTIPDVARTWWPLALSWMMMGLEMPLLTAVIARLDDPTVHLAAYGAVVFPLALLIEAPIIMMLAASTSWCRDEPSYRRLYRFMWRLSAGLTLIHGLVAFTPLFDLVVVGIINAPAEIVEPSRLGLCLMLPWTWAIADRRFHQGVLIRFGRSRSVGTGTVVRLCATASGMGLATLAGLPGIAVAATALSCGVLVEMTFARLVVAPVIRGPLAAAERQHMDLDLRSLLVFYVPLAVTPLVGLLGQPIGSAAMSRMPDAMSSLASWTALSGTIFLTRSAGIAFNEVVVSLAGRRDDLPVLWRFGTLLGVGTTVVLGVLAFTPVGRLWFSGVCGLNAELTALAVGSVWIGGLMPGLQALHSYYQGQLVHAQRTRGVPESMTIFLGSAGVVLVAGTALQSFPGVQVVLAAFTTGLAASTLWLRFRVRGLPDDDRPTAVVPIDPCPAEAAISTGRRG